jgi:primary-amine oxidase
MSPDINGLGSVHEGLNNLRLKTNRLHPLASLTPEEIARTAELIRSAWPSRTNIHYKVITLLEPPKDELVPYFEAEHSRSPLPNIERKAFANYYLRNTVSDYRMCDWKGLTHQLLQNKYHEAVVNLSTAVVEKNARLGANIHAPGDEAEIFAMEKIALEDETVRAALKKLRLPEGSVVVSDPWIYGMCSH